MTSNSHTRSILFALSAVLFWSTIATAIKLSLEGMNFIQLLFYSSLTSSIALLLIAFYTNRKELFGLFRGESIKINILFGLINPFVFYIVLFRSYELLPAQEALLLNFTWPIVVSVFSVIFLKQKLSYRTILGLIFAFIGVIIIATRGDILSLKFQNKLGVTLALGSTLIWATFWIINLKDKRDPAIKLLGAFLSGTFFTSIYILLFDSFVVNSNTALIGAAYTGLFEMGITFFLWLKGLELSNNKSKTATLAYLAPILSLFLITLVLGEQLMLSSLLGFVFIMGGILYQQLEK